MLKYEVFEPVDAEFVTDDLLVLPNEIGATLEDYHGHRARQVAQDLGMRVLAYERPHSAQSVGVSEALRLRHRLGVENMVNLWRNTAILLGRAIVLEEQSAHIHVAGHSAGGTEAIMITEAEEFVADSLTVTDPSGVHHHYPITGELHYIDYSLRVDPGNGDDDEPILGQPSKEVMRDRMMSEVMIFSRHWRSTIAMSGLVRIGLWTETRVDLTFPEYTFNAKTHQLDNIADRLNVLRDSDGSFRVRVLPGTYHSDFSDLEFFTNIVKENVTNQHGRDDWI